jgi:large subunit ribosomal protein L18
MKRIEDKIRRRSKRKARVRGKISGTADRPRMSVFRSSKHVYVQIVDDSKGHTLAAVSNLEADYRSLKSNVADAEKLGAAIGDALKKLNIQSVVFDRNGYIYHGIVKAVAEGARKAGIKF